MGLGPPAGIVGRGLVSPAGKDTIMNNNNPFPQRKHPRFKTFDYSRNGMYFVTICTTEKAKILSHIDSTGKIVLSKIGIEAKNQIDHISERFKGVEVTSYVIMPNHIHLVVYIHQRPVIIRAEEYSKMPSLCDVIGAFKSVTSRICWKKYGAKHIFQRSFYEHIIRSYESLSEIEQYIVDNPARWKTDQFFV